MAHDREAGGLIKRIRLATAKRGLGREEFAGGWREAVAAAASAPARARPVRLTVSVSLPEIPPASVTTASPSSGSATASTCADSSRGCARPPGERFGGCAAR